VAAPSLADDRPARSHAGRLAARRLRQEGVEGVVLSFVDTAGINRIKTVPVDRLEQAASWGVGMSPVFDVFLADDSSIRTEHFGGPDGDLRLVPDLARLSVLAGQPGWAWAPVNRYTQDGEPYVLCQRLYAAGVAERARAAGLDVLAAVEIEWAVGAQDAGGFVPACTGPAYGMTRLVELSDYARDVLQALQRQGVEVEQLHPEYSDGQFEVSVAATDLVGAADRSVLVRQTIRAVAARHGLLVSFSPSVVAGHVGNGGHVHLSASSTGRNVFAGGDRRYGMTPVGEAFAAGILEQIRGLSAIGAPTAASYLRLVPSHWAGAYACWGRETRESALRFVTGMDRNRDAAANLEAKCFDLAANPYLLLGALVAAGLAGVEAGLELPAEVTGDPAWLDADDLAARGVQRLPESLHEAADCLAASEVLREALGKPLFEVVLAVRRAEAERFDGVEPEAVAAALRWVY
jgi:glutamine synthetase